MKKRVLIYLSISIFCIAQNVICYYVFNSAYAKHTVEDRINEQLSNARVISQGLFDADDKDAYLDSLWALFSLKDKNNFGVTISLYHNDSIKFWNNNIIDYNCRCYSSTASNTIERI